MQPRLKDEDGCRTVKSAGAIGANIVAQSPQKSEDCRRLTSYTEGILFSQHVQSAADDFAKLGAAEGRFG